MLDHTDADADGQADNHKIKMSNALTRAAHGLNLREKRIVMTAAAKLWSIAKPVPGVVHVTKITAAEYANAWDLDHTTAYEQLKSGTEELYQRSVTFYEAAHKRNGKPLALTRVSMRWIGQAKYHHGEGWVEVHWWPAMLPHLVGLRNHFTTYQLQQASALRSVYSWRLLELLMRFQSTGWAEYTIEDFAEAMEATEKQRANFAAIRRKMIEPAIKELSDKDGWSIEWNPIKAGRRVVAIRFDFKRDNQRRLPFDEQKQLVGPPPLQTDRPKPPRSARSRKPVAAESSTWTPAAPDCLEPPKLRRPPPVWDEVTVRPGREKTPTDSGINENAETST